MSKSSDAVKKWRQDSKKRIVLSMGGKCQCCSYDRCNEALELHHIDPSQKDFSFGAIRANPKSWIKIVEELKKCILVCSNCHREIHAGIRDLPENYQRFDTSFEAYRITTVHKHPCPVCGIDTPDNNRCCSLSCSGKLRRRVDWESIDLQDLISKSSITDIAEQLNVSWNAVKKRMTKLGI